MEFQSKSIPAARRSLSLPLPLPPSLSLLATNPLQPPASPFCSEGGLFIYLREGNRGYGIALRFCKSFIRIVREGNYKSNPAGANPFRNFRLERPRSPWRHDEARPPSSTVTAAAVCSTRPRRHGADSTPSSNPAGKPADPPPVHHRRRPPLTGTRIGGHASSAHSGVLNEVYL